MTVRGVVAGGRSGHGAQAGDREAAALDATPGARRRSRARGGRGPTCAWLRSVGWHARRPGWTPTLALGLVALLCIAALASQMTLKGSASEGRRLFHSSAIGTNGLSCADCHADFDETRQDDGIIRPAHSLWNAAMRETWWGQDPKQPDAYANIAAAAVVCVEHYMQNPSKLTAQQMLDVQAYLVSITPRPGRTAQALAPGADATGQYAGFDGGNHFDGKRLFYAACHTCHPNGNAGIAPAIPRDRTPAFYAAKVREGDGLGSVLAGVDPNAYDAASGQHMPFFGVDRLTDAQLRDIIAFIKAPPEQP